MPSFSSKPSLWTCYLLLANLFGFSEKNENVNEVTFDLCIIGAGLFGSVAARHASAHQDLKICIIGLDEPSNASEYKARDVFSSHYDSGRILTHMFESPAYQKLVQASIREWRALQIKSVPNKFYYPVGFLKIGKKDSGSMRRLEDVSAAVHTPLRSIYGQKSMNETFPFLKLQNNEYALHDYAGAGAMNPRKTIQAQLKVSEQQGCRIIVDKVENVKPLKENFHIIETSRNGQIKSKRVLFTTGAFTDVNEFDALPEFDMSVHEEYAALVRIPHEEAERLRSMPSMEYETDVLSRYIVPAEKYPDGKYYIKIGIIAKTFGRKLSTKEEIREVFISNYTNEEAVAIAEILFQIIPGLNSDGIIPKLCVLSQTPTGYPYIDRWTPTVTVAIVGNGWGATTSEEIGRLAAHLSLFGVWDSEIPKSLFKIVTKK